MTLTLDYVMPAAVIFLQPRMHCAHSAAISSARHAMHETIPRFWQSMWLNSISCDCLHEFFVYKLVFVDVFVLFHVP